MPQLRLYLSMKLKFILFLLLIPSLLWAQKQKKYYANGTIKSIVKAKKNKKKETIYYPNGKKKSMAIRDIDGTLIALKQWNYSGELTYNKNFLKERLKKGATDLSFIRWKRKDSVSVFFVEKNRLSTKTGDSLNIGDTIYFHYRCLDSAGYEYDNSLDRNQPLYSVVGTHYYLKSFLDVLLTMKQNEKAYILIPPKYGYGDKSAGNIPPNTTLVYYVDILDFKEGETK